MKKPYRRSCPVVEGMESRLLLSTASGKLAKLATSGSVLHPAFTLANVDGDIYSRQSGAATLTVARTGKAGTATVEVIAQANPNAPTTSAQPGVQFEPIHQTIVFAPGQSTQAVTIPLIPGNDGPEATTILVALKPVGGSTLTSFENVTIVKRADVAHPKVESARLLLKGSQVVGTVVNFSENMDPTTISDPRRYVLVDTHKSGVLDWVSSLTFRSRSQGNLGFRSATYNADTHSLTLHLSKPVKNLGRYQFGAVWGEGKGKVSAPVDTSGNTLARFSLQLNGSGALTRGG